MTKSPLAGACLFSEDPGQARAEVTLYSEPLPT